MTNAVNIAGLGGALTVTSGVVNFSSTPTVNSTSIASQWTTTGANIYYTTGSVGIGTVTPNAPLEVFKTSNKTAIFGNATANNGNYITLNGASTTKNWVISNNMVVGAEFGIGRTSANGGSDIGSTHDLMIDSQGNVLVGTTSSTSLSGPAIKLVGGTNTGGGSHTLLITYSNNAQTFALRNDGYVTATAIYSLTTASGANVNVDASGFLQRSTSALKYKQDIRDLESIDITKFRPVRYKSKCANDDQELDHFGIVADEVDVAGIKELVSYGLTGDVEGFQYERLTVVLVKAMQEQQATITALTARITALEAR